MRGNKKREEVAEIVADIILENLGVSRDRIRSKASIVDDLGGDSLDKVNILGEIEEKFKIEILDEEAEGIDTVDQLVELILKK